MISKRLSEVRFKDFLFVLLYGIFLPILFGILLGLIDYFLIGMISFSIANILFFIVAINTGNLVRKQYENPHLLYSIVAGIGMVFSAIIIHTLPVFYSLNGVAASNLFDLRIYFGVFLLVINPLNWIQNFSLDLLIWLAFLALGTYFGIRRTL